jgi:hypothetical protein
MLNNASGNMPVVGGQARLTVMLSPGASAIKGNYSGDAIYPAASATYQVSVYRLSTTLTITSNSASTRSGDPIVFVATVNTTQPSAGLAPPSGQVQVYSGCVCGIFGAMIGKTLIGNANLANGSATITINSLPPGSTRVVAVYAGDNTWAAATSNILTQTVATMN